MFANWENDNSTKNLFINSSSLFTTQLVIALAMHQYPHRLDVQPFDDECISFYITPIWLNKNKS